MSSSPVSIDTGLACLVALARFHHIALDPEQVNHHFCPANSGQADAFDDGMILRAAQASGLRARRFTPALKRLASQPLPAIAKAKDGSYFIIARTARTVPSVARKHPAFPLSGADGTSSADTGAAPGFLVHDLRKPVPELVTADVLDAFWSGELILIARRTTFIDRLQQTFDIRWFIPAIFKYRRLFGEVLLASFFLQLFALATPMFFQVVVDKVLVHRGFTTLDVLAAGFLVVSVFEVVLGAIRSYVFSHTTNRIDVELGARLYQHLVTLPLAWFQARQVGQSVARVRELDNIRSFITGTTLMLVIDLLFTFVFFSVMWCYSKALACVVLASIPFYVVLSLFITPVLRHRLNERFRLGAQNQCFLVESVTGIETVKSLAVEPQMQRCWEEQLAAYVHSSFRAQNLNSMASQAASLINKIITLGILWYGAHLVADNAISVGQLIAINMLAGRVSGPILKLVQVWQDFQQAGISLQRLGDILNTPRESAFNANRSTMPRLKGQVEFDHIRFRYHVGGKVILDDINLAIKAGEVIGIVGKSGSGKSTLGKLIQRLHVPEHGRVLIDGIDLATVDTAWLRRNIGVVLQENFLFNRSVRDNIALVNPALPMEVVVQAATMAGAHEFIAEMPEAYDSLVGERGCNLSGGQRQRIAIARALITQPRILIFDEATSALDYESERIIQDNMATICQGRTVFIIAHRLSTVRHCDRIIVMDQGRIIEEGSHDDLMQKNGYYAQLQEYQNPSRPSFAKRERTSARVIS